MHTTSGESSAAALRWTTFFLWLALVAASLWLAANTPKTGDGFTRGMNRVAVFFQWQAAAFVVALFAAVNGRRRGVRSTLARILAYLPAATQIAVAIALITLVLVVRIL